MTEDDLRSEFEKYGEVENISVIKDKVTKERKGFAYVKYIKLVDLTSFSIQLAMNNFFRLRFSHAAEAFESCSSKFKAVFAEPKSSSRSSQGNFSDRTDTRDARSSRYDDYSNFNFGRNESHGSFVMPIVATAAPSSSEAQLNIICSTSVSYLLYVQSPVIILVVLRLIKINCGVYSISFPGSIFVKSQVIVSKIKNLIHRRLWYFYLLHLF